MDVCAFMDKVEVFPSSFPDNAGITSVFPICNASGNFTVQAAEDGCAAGVVERGEVAVGEDDVGDLDGVPGEELDDVWGKTGFYQDFIDKVVGGDGGGRRFPDNDVAHQGRSSRKVTGDGGEVEGGDGVDETLQRPVFHAVPYSRGVVDGLLCV